MFFRDNVIWAKDAEGKTEESPYCARCFELDGKPVHLVVWQNPLCPEERVGKCPECKVEGVPFPKPEQVSRRSANAH